MIILMTLEEIVGIEHFNKKLRSIKKQTPPLGMLDLEQSSCKRMKFLRDF